MRILSRGLFCCRFIALFVFFFLSAAYPRPAASFSEVIINEIAWMGSEVSGIEPKNWWRYEWLELYNDADSQRSLEGWKIELYRAELDWSLVLRGTIPGKGYFLIVSSDKIFPNHDLNYANLGGKFNNNGQRILLKNNSGDVVDEIDCFSAGKWFAGDNSTKQTMERKSVQSAGNNADNWQNSQTGGGTPKAPNGNPQNTIASSPSPEILPENELLSPQPSPTTQPPTEEKQNEPASAQKYPSGIFINETIPSPEGPDETNEWIEFFNQNGFEVDLSGWKITDVVGQTKTYVFPENTKIAPKGFLTLSRPTTGITLNNDKDGLRLLRPDNNVADSLDYEKAPQNQSFNKTEAGWFWSKTLTPDSKNVVGAQNSEPKAFDEAEKNTGGQFQPEKGLAAIGAQWPRENYTLLLAASFVATFSAIIILILKRKIKKRVDFIEN